MLKEEVKPRLNEVRGLIMDLAYSEGGLEDYEILIKIDQLLKLFEISVTDLYDDRDNYRRRARKWQYELGKAKIQLDMLCEKEKNED